MTRIYKIFSWILHPLWIPMYVLFFLWYQLPQLFTEAFNGQVKFKFIGAFVCTIFLPAFSLFLLWRLQFTKSLAFRTQRDRIIPLFLFMFFYWWMYYLSRNMKDQPAVLQFYYLALFFNTIVGVLLNNFLKISLHTMSISVAATALILFATFYQLFFVEAITIGIASSFVIIVARWFLKQERPAEILLPFGIGVLATLFAYFIVS